MVDSAETPITVNNVAFSFCGWLGNATDNAKAAEAPQMAVAPPVSIPNKRWKPMSFATTTDTEIVTTIKVNTKTNDLEKVDLNSDSRNLLQGNAHT